MKILMISAEYPPDKQNGVAVTFAELFEQTRRQCNTRLIAGWHRARSLIPPEAIAVDLSTSSTTQHNVKLLQSLKQEIQRWKPDILIINGFLPYLGKIPCISLMQGSSLYSNKGRMQRIKTTIIGKFLSRHSRVLCNDEMQVRFLNQIGIPEKKLQVLRHGIDVSQYPMIEKTPQSPIQILCPARILPEKKIERIIDAIAKLKKKEKQNVELHIVGTVLNHVYADKLRIQAYGLPIFFHTDVSDMRTYLQQAHLVIYPHQSSSYIHRTAMEAMALGRCVLWYGDSLCKDSLVYTGLNCSGDSDQLRDQIRNSITNLEEIIEKGRQGRSHITQYHSWDTIWQFYPDIFRNLLQS